MDDACCGDSRDPLAARAKRRRLSPPATAILARPACEGSGGADGAEATGVSEACVARQPVLQQPRPPSPPSRECAQSAPLLGSCSSTRDSGFTDGEDSSSAPLLTPRAASEEEDEDVESCASDVSDLSLLSGEEWKPLSGPLQWVQRQVDKGSLTPREMLQHLLPHASIPQDCDSVTLWRMIVGILSQPPKRTRLTHVNTLDDVVQLIRRSERIIVLTGAGVSVSCGIPDFRSRDGVYARLSVEFPTLPDPQSMFDIHYFRRDPRPFFKFAKEIYPGQFAPSVSHRFIKLIETHGKLLRNYTQNIDTLEEVCGLKRVINCHGSFSTATCTRCGLQVRAQEIQADVLEQRIPLCPRCPDSPSERMAVMKPDIVFFGESLSDQFHSAMAADKDECDLLLVMGSSLKVRPVALIPSSIDPSVPQILINREPLDHVNFDVELLGDCDVIVQELSRRLGDSWTGICQSPDLMREIQAPVPPATAAGPEPSATGDHLPAPRGSLADDLPVNSYLFIPPSRYVFPGAEVYDAAPAADTDDDEIDFLKESSDWSALVEESSGSSSNSGDDWSHEASVHKAPDPLLESCLKWEDGELGHSGLDGAAGRET